MITRKSALSEEIELQKIWARFYGDNTLKTHKQHDDLVKERLPHVNLSRKYHFDRAHKQHKLNEKRLIWQMDTYYEHNHMQQFTKTWIFFLHNHEKLDDAAAAFRQSINVSIHTQFWKNTIADHVLCLSLFIMREIYGSSRRFRGNSFFKGKVMIEAMQLLNFDEFGSDKICNRRYLSWFR